MGEEYHFHGEEVVEVYESYAGSYWVITEDNGATGYGYASLAGHRELAEWGRINLQDLKESKRVWTVDKISWTVAGTDDINIQHVPTA
jgi:hypothetical protein